MTPLSSRLKDALWSLRRRFGIGRDINKIIEFVIFDTPVTERQIDEIVGVDPRSHGNFDLNLITQAHQTFLQYRQYQQTGKGYHRVMKGIIALENAARE